MHNEELHNLYASPDIMVMRKRWAGHVACMGAIRNAYKILRSENLINVRTYAKMGR